MNTMQNIHSIVDNSQNDQLSLESIKSLLPAKLSSDSEQLFLSLLNEAVNQMGENQVVQKYKQWQILLCQKLNSNARMALLKDLNHRKLLISFIKSSDIDLYKHSYFNRSKLDTQYLKYLEILKPANFMEVLMLVNKLKVINKFYYHQLKQQASENEVDIRIIRILETCNVRQRSVNSTMNKFLMIVKDDDFRFSLIRELGKLLRYSFKKDKERQKQTNQKIEVQNSNEQGQSQSQIQSQFEQKIQYKTQNVTENNKSQIKSEKQKQKQYQRVRQNSKMKKKQHQIMKIDKRLSSSQNSQQGSVPSILKSKSIQDIYNPYGKQDKDDENNDKYDFIDQ